MIFEKLDIALIDLLVYTGSYSRAANSYPPTYPGCHINTAHISNFISAIYDVIFLNFDKFDLVDDIGSYKRAAKSYPPAYPGCHINTEHIFNFFSAIYD